MLYNFLFYNNVDNLKLKIKGEENNVNIFNSKQALRMHQ